MDAEVAGKVSKPPPDWRAAAGLGGTRFHRRGTNAPQLAPGTQVIRAPALRRTRRAVIHTYV
jgi:hypothetical protein